MRGAATASGTAAATACTSARLPRSAPRRRAPAGEAMHARCWEGQPPAVGEHSATGRRRRGGGGRGDARPAPGGKERDAAIHLAARLPGLDSRRAAACFSSSSPVGAMWCLKIATTGLSFLREPAARRPF